ncbi:MAG: hypothetical protein H8K04_05625 [Nitrospira sp.]
MERQRTVLSETRRGFLVGTIIIFVAIALVLLIWPHGVPEWAPYPAIVALLAQVLLIHRREQALYTSRRWRFWYSLAVAGFACDLMTKHLWREHDMLIDPLQVRSQLLLGGLLLFYVMVLPITLHLAIRDKKS